ncbi:MAG: DUF1343 domain-containing protein [Acidobacteriota bacterium]|nr:DUF1343 domain-containing protein [Acidobacteriota bacterium]
MQILVFLCVAHGSAATYQRDVRHSAHAVQVGLDVLETDKFAPLRGRHVGVITNHTGVDSQGRSIVEVLAHAPDVQVVALFSPEHGLAGSKDENVPSTKDRVSGLPVYSLYGETRRPTEEMLAGIDALVFDVQDAGVRFYTYTTTMAYCMEEAAKRNIAFFVLDRPNPLGGEIVEGPLLDADKMSFTAYFPLPVRYGLTIGELAQLFNEEKKIDCDLHVIAMKNWRRNYFYEDTGLRWVPPSPNLRTLNGSILYPGLEILQNAGISVGRGTETPFEEFGAPWIHGAEVAARLNERHIAGLFFSATDFTPSSGLYSGQKCGGVAIKIIDDRAVRSMSMGLEIATLLKTLYPEHFDAAKLLLLAGNAETVRQLQEGKVAEQITAGWAKDLRAFEKIRRKYLLYK